MRRPLAVAIFAGLGLSGLATGMIGALGSAGCQTPASQIDGGDLLGVFDRDASKSDGGIVAIGSASSKITDAGKGPDASDAADAGPVETKVRAADEAGCVASTGEPEVGLKRTLGRPSCRGGEVLEWRDGSGEPRYGCVFSPQDLEKRAPLPVVVFFHGETPGLDDPAAVAKQTSLKAQLETFDLSGKAEHKGFVLLVVQGRAIGKLGATYDTGYSGADNVDRTTTDHFVDVLADRGWVDAKRIYASGIGRGGQMAASYAMVRADRVAAFAVFGAPPPTVPWRCPGPQPPGAVVYRACDARTSCDDVETWVHARESSGAETKVFRLGEDIKEEPNCAVSKCSKKKGEANHDRWPKGREKDLLAFLSQHALAP